VEVLPSDSLGHTKGVDPVWVCLIHLFNVV
jgi:hypothetical protein